MTSKINSYSYLSYFLLAIFIFLILFFPSIVNATTLTPRGALDNYSNNNVFDTTGIYNSDERPQENFYYSSTLNTSYSRKLFGLRAYFNTSLTKNHTYRLNINTTLNNFNTSAFNNADLYVCFGSSWSGANSNCTTSLGYSAINSNSISINFRPTSNYSYFSIRIGPQTNKNYPLTTSFSYIITSFTLDDLNSPASSPSNQNVIDNDNQNTQAIIDKQQRDTLVIQGQIDERSQELHDTIIQTETNIINNSNSNTNTLVQGQDRAHDDLISCSSQTVHFTTYMNGYLGDQGQILSNNSYIITNYIELSQSRSITFDIYNNNNGGIRYGDYCVYDKNKTLLWCSRLDKLDSTLYNIASNNDSIRYFRTTLYKTEAVLKNAYITGVICSNKIDDIKDYISDDTEPNSSSIVDTLDDIGVGNGPISSLVTLPLTLLDKFEDGISSSCSAFPLGNLLGTNLVLPCIDIPDLIGSNLWTIIDAITSIFMIYNIVMLIITAFDHLTSLSDDFDTLYTPDSIYESRLVKKRGYERHGG